MCKRTIGLLAIILCSSPAWAAPADDCVTEQASCNNGCVERSDPACLGECAARAMDCIHQANNSGGDESPSGPNYGQSFSQGVQEAADQQKALENR